MASAGMSNSEIAKECGVTRQAVSAALNYRPSDGKRGPKGGWADTSKCRECGVALTPDNAEFCHPTRCKPCAGAYVLRLKASRMSMSELESAVSKYRRILNIYSDVLDARRGDHE